MAFKKTSDFINEIILNDIKTKEITQICEPETILIHSSIHSTVLEFLARTKVEVLQHLGYYELTVGESKFDMEMLIIGPTKTGRSSSLLRLLVEMSQFTYFWEKKFTLFRVVERYHELEEFIAINDLQKHVISVKEVSGVNYLRAPIKIVTFDSTTDKNKLLINYLKFLREKSLSVPEYQKTLHYYITYALPWHKPKMFFTYSTPFRNPRISLELQTFLTCMRELTYAREPHLDLISLCSLKLAFCDDRNETPASADLEFEINALIERHLRRYQRNETYIKNGNFDIIQYAVETNSQFDTYCLAVINLIYTFQDIFHSTNLPEKYFLEDICIREFTQTLMLTDEVKDLKILRDRSNMPYNVNTKNYKKMNSKLFCELLKCRNAQVIRLDINDEWIHVPYFINFDVCGSKSIELVGTNEFYFIERFMKFLIKMPLFLTFGLIIIIEEATLLPPSSFNIFKNLKVKELVFRNSKITFTMLTELLECDLQKITLKFDDCTIEDQTTWSLLINEFDRENVVVHILEGENEWQYLFESVANHLARLKLNQFQFKCPLRIRRINIADAFLGSDVKFTFDEVKMRLDMQGSHGDLFDLYYLKYFNTEYKSNDDDEDFDFYQ